MIHVFVVGSKGIPAQYGGFETFVENLTANKRSENIQYHVSCMSNESRVFMHNDAECFNIRTPLPGAPGRILHVSLAMKYVEHWKTAHPNENTIVYILGCRIGPLLIPHAHRLHQLGVKVYCNPDGLEWKRDKWSAAEKLFLRYCESCLVRYSDMAICDSKNIETYIQETYKNKVKATSYIAYGADTARSQCPEAKLAQWLDNHSLHSNGYYLIVGRFVPENNYETMIREFMKSNTSRDLVIVSNVEKNKFYRYLADKTGFEQDTRIKFVGTVYEAELIKKIREAAYCYLHGHEVGGTNPSLLEALASTKVNLLLDVGFNREVAENSALYWIKEPGSLAALINSVDNMDFHTISDLDSRSTARVATAFNWNAICTAYEHIWNNT